MARKKKSNKEQSEKLANFVDAYLAQQTTTTTSTDKEQQALQATVMQLQQALAARPLRAAKKKRIQARLEKAWDHKHKKPRFWSVWWRKLMRLPRYLRQLLRRHRRRWGVAAAGLTALLVFMVLP